MTEDFRWRIDPRVPAPESPVAGCRRPLVHRTRQAQRRRGCAGDDGPPPELTEYLAGSRARRKVNNGADRSPVLVPRSPPRSPATVRRHHGKKPGITDGPRETIDSHGADRRKRWSLLWKYLDRAVFRHSALQLRMKSTSAFACCIRATPRARRNNDRHRPERIVRQRSEKCRPRPAAARSAIGQTAAGHQRTGRGSTIGGNPCRLPPRR